MYLWTDNSSRLRILAGVVSDRIQFLICISLLLVVCVQIGLLHLWSFPLTIPLMFWILVIGSRCSVEVIFERDFRRIIVKYRRLLGFVAQSVDVYEFSQLQAVPITARSRYRDFGGGGEDMFWDVYLKFSDCSSIMLGSVVGDSSKVEKILNEIGRFVGANFADSAYDTGKSIDHRKPHWLVEVLDSEATVRVGQLLCLLMIALSLFAAPGMAVYYVIALVFGTWADWLARRGDR